MRKRTIGWILPTSLILGAALSSGFEASAQSLVDVARKEKERRRKVAADKARKRGGAFTDRELGRRRRSRPQPAPGPIAKSGASVPPTRVTPLASLDPDAFARDGDVEAESAATASAALASVRPEPEPTPQTTTARNDFLSGRPLLTDDFYLRGAVYADWFRVGPPGGEYRSQLSTRLRAEMGRRPGDGWRGVVDLRDRFNAGADQANQLIVYDARLVYDRRDRPVHVSLGQQNLYDSAGAGQLLGGVVGVDLSRDLMLGGYGGFERDLYSLDLDAGYQKYGLFTRYLGAGARSLTLSYNALRFDGTREREYLYASGLLPVPDLVTLFGNLEYELSSQVPGENRLSRLFLNVRFDVTDWVDVTGHYSSGKGLDFHRFLLDQSRDPSLSAAELERFYYTTQYGARLSVKPHRRMRLFVAQRRSEQIDQAIQNHTTSFGASAWDAFGTGLSFYGSYNLNRGDRSENDSYRISVGRDFGILSWTGVYSNAFNGIRIDASTGLPVILHLPDRRTISNDFFFSLSRALAISMEHEYSSREGDDENALFFRLIYRL